MITGLRIQDPGLTLEQMQKHITTEYDENGTELQISGVSVAIDAKRLQSDTCGYSAYEENDAEVLIVRGTKQATIEEGWIIYPTEILARFAKADFEKLYEEGSDLIDPDSY